MTLRRVHCVSVVVALVGLATFAALFLLNRVVPVSVDAALTDISTIAPSLRSVCVTITLANMNSKPVMADLSDSRIVFHAKTSWTETALAQHLGNTVTYRIPGHDKVQIKLPMGLLEHEASDSVVVKGVRTGFAD